MSNFDYSFESMMGYLFSPNLGEKKDNPLDNPFSKESLEKIKKSNNFNANYIFTKKAISRINEYSNNSNSAMTEIISKDIKNILIDILKEELANYETKYGSEE